MISDFCVIVAVCALKPDRELLLAKLNHVRNLTKLQLQISNVLLKYLKILFSPMKLQHVMQLQM